MSDQGEPPWVRLGSVDQINRSTDNWDYHQILRIEVIYIDSVRSSNAWSRDI